MEINSQFRIEQYFVPENGNFPNNPLLPVLLYRNVFKIGMMFPGDKILRHFEGHQWVNGWKDGIFEYHHYHSTAHEVLAVYHGGINVQLGGENGLILRFECGDVLVLPVGVAHKNKTPDTPFKCVGAYPKGQFYNMNFGTKGERPQTDDAIRKTKSPEQDPVFGLSGPLHESWHLPGKP